MELIGREFQSTPTAFRSRIFVMGWNDRCVSHRCGVNNLAPFHFLEGTLEYTTFTPEVCADIPGLDGRVVAGVTIQGKRGTNTPIDTLLSATSLNIELIGSHPEATSRPPDVPCTGAYYAWEWPAASSAHLGEGFTRYIINYTIRGMNSVDVPISNRLTTTYQVSGGSGVSVGDDIAWIVYATYVSVDDNENTSTLSVLVADGMGTMQACPAVSPTDCRPPSGMTFKQYLPSTRALDFDFVAPTSGGLARSHYQPQYRRSPATAWTNLSFTVAADSTTWGVIFDNESFTSGRTIDFRLVAICTGDVESVPSNVVSYTYPGSTPTVSATDCRPPRTMTFKEYTSSTRAVDFDFLAPLSGGLTRLHYQPQYRRRPATAWSNLSFTVAADSTTWGVIFDNESFTSGRTIDFRLVAICTGDVESVPSNVVFYTYPGPTITPTPMGVRFPDLTALLLVCRVSGSNNETEVTATWAAPDGTLPADVTRIGYSVTWLDLGDPTSINVLVQSTSATLTGEYPRKGQGAGPCYGAIFGDRKQRPYFHHWTN